MNETAELSTILSQFDYLNEGVLPEELLNTLQKAPNVTVSVRGEDTLSMQELFFENQALRAQLVNAGKATDRTKIPTLYVYGRGKKLYYDPQTGERLGDDLGISDWISR